MNTDLLEIARTAEGRYLDAAERARFELYAQGMAERIAAARRLAEREEQIVTDATERLLLAFPSLRELSNVRDKSVRDYKLHLRYVALAHVQLDEQMFRRRYADWIAELLLALMDREVLVRAYEILSDCLIQHLDPADAREFSHYTRVFIRALEGR